MFVALASCAALAAVASAEPLKYADLTLEQLQSMTLWERLRSNDWKIEYITIAFTLAFILLYKVGDYWNEQKVRKFLDAQADVLTRNFAQFGVSPLLTYVKDNSEAYSSYATGRANIASVDFTFKLQPRHNLFVWILELILSYFVESVLTPQDRVDIVITPSAEYDNFISAIVSKIGMNDFRKFNYYLSLTKTSDSAKLPELFVFMSESSEFQEKTLTEELRQALKLETASFLRYVAFTDQPVERPQSVFECAPHRRIVISSKLVGGKDQLAQIAKILSATFNLVDNLATKKLTFKPEALRKVVKTREAEISKIKKIQEEIKAEIKAEEQAKLKRDERAKARNLSSAEQEKLDRKALEKKQKKAMKKQKVRM